MLSFLDEIADINKLENTVRIVFEIEDQKVQYVKPLTCNATWTTDNGFIFKKVDIEGIAGQFFEDLMLEMNQRGRLMVNIFIGDKLFIRSWLTSEMISCYLDKNYGILVEFSIFDRFIGLKVSDIIKTKPAYNSFLQQFIGNVLYELEFISSENINTYPRKISKGYELVKNGTGVTANIPLKTFEKDNFLHEQGRSLIGECLSISNVFLSSNGYDTLYLEAPNSDIYPIDAIDSKADNDIAYIGKVGQGQSESSITPSTVIILNAKGLENKNSDNNTSLITRVGFGLPNIVKVNNVSFNASYQQISSMLDYNFAGIKARQDSILVKLNNRVLTPYKQFYQPNRKISVSIPEFGLVEDMVIIQVGMNISAKQGSELILNLSTESAFLDNASLRQKISLMK